MNSYNIDLGNLNFIKMTESRFRNFDAMPNVRKAGVSTKATDSAAMCLQPSDN